MIKSRAWDKIYSLWNVTNLKLNEAKQNLNKLLLRDVLDDEELEYAERSVDFYKKELNTYDYLLNLILNDRGRD